MIIATSVDHDPDAAVNRADIKVVNRAADSNRANKAAKHLDKPVRPRRIAKATPSVLVPVLVQHAVTKAAVAKVAAIRVANPIAAVVVDAAVRSSHDVAAVAMIRAEAAMGVDAIEARVVTSRFRIRLASPRINRPPNRLPRQWPKAKSR